MTLKIALYLYKTLYKTPSHIMTACSCVILLLISPFSYATPTTPDAEQPVHISANTLETHQKEGKSIYQGNVIITQGSLTLKGDRVVIIHPNGQLKSVKATGQQASFKRYSQIDQAWLTGHANLIEYQAVQRTVLLIGKAQIEQPGKHHIKGPRLFYDIAKQTLQAQSTPTEKGRVTVTFNPEPTNPAPADKK